jgi:DNA-binding PadR family transcriptional regulator
MVSLHALQVLAAISRSGGAAHYEGIAAALLETGRDKVNSSSLYSTLSALSRKGLITKTPQQPRFNVGRGRFLYGLTAGGAQLLREQSASVQEQ